MPQFRKKPVVIEAIQYSGKGNFHNSQGRLPEWLWQAFENGSIITSGGKDPIFIITLEGRMEVGIDDWIIRGVQGELYPCKPDIFEATYERVEIVDGEVFSLVASETNEPHGEVCTCCKGDDAPAIVHAEGCPCMDWVYGTLEGDDLEDDRGKNATIGFDILVNGGDE